MMNKINSSIIELAVAAFVVLCLLHIFAVDLSKAIPFMIGYTGMHVVLTYMVPAFKAYRLRKQST